MPLKLIKHLHTRELSLLHFRKDMADAPMELDRAESAYRSFERTMTKIFEEAPKVHELRGLAQGMALAGPSIVSRQEYVKKLIADEKLDAASGKFTVQELGSTAKLIVENQKTKIEEYQKAVGMIDGLYWAAVNALDEVEHFLNRYERSKAMAEEESDDPLGWGTPNGQRPLSTEAPQNGDGAKAKVVAIKRARRAPKKKDTTPEAN